jgi:3-deoxy-D-manno-octulosonate 8-phosphate phosphatase (KDO 8-P phosphatase)
MKTRTKNRKIRLSPAQSAPGIRHPAISPASWARLRLFAMDVDGILTDGTVTIHSDGTEAKTFSVLDGLGLVRCRDAGIVLGWISGRASPASTVRAAELKIPHLLQGRTDKLAALRELAGRLGLTATEVCYMGDDDLDAPALAWAGIGVTVPGAMPAAVAAADYVTARPGGGGAVREVCEHLLRRPI